MQHHHHFLKFPFILSFFLFAIGKPTNISVDDSFPDPLTGNSIEYLPAIGGSVAEGNWQDGQDCNQACTAQLDITKVFNGTYRYAESNIDPGAQQSASFLFSGSAVYVVCIWASVAPAGHVQSLGNSDMTFMLNGSVVGTFTRKVTTRSEDASGVYNYDTPVYVNNNLPSGLHNLTIQNGLSGKESVIMLDRIIYTTDADVNEPQVGNDISQSGLNSNISIVTSSASETSSVLQHTVTVESFQLAPTKIGATDSFGDSRSASESSSVSPSQHSPVPSTSPATHTSASSLPLGVIGAISAGSVSVIAVSIFVVVWLRKARARRRRSAIYPFVLSRQRDAGTSQDDMLPPEYASEVNASDCSTTRGTEVETREKA